MTFMQRVVRKTECDVALGYMTFQMIYEIGYRNMEDIKRIKKAILRTKSFNMSRIVFLKLFVYDVVHSQHT